MKTRRNTLILFSIASLLIGSSALAERGGRQQRRVSRRFATQHTAAERLIPQIRNEHGKRSYQTALKFAKEHDLPVATVTKSGQPRILVNVPQDKVAAWTETFSAGKCFIEPFFGNNLKTGKPGWSYMRIGDKHHDRYGAGDTYRPGSPRTAFPVALSAEEQQRTTHEITTRTNAPWNYGGGDPVRTGRNCTNWVTYVIHPYTGVQTGSVVHHGATLFDQNRSGRLTVMAVMTNALQENFGADAGEGRNWH
ncbi:MAG: hypothetical protein KC503_31900 [Myxococcales bacterium]|nr:hypothetical protein [Myxococcales bacterium]